MPTAPSGVRHRNGITESVAGGRYDQDGKGRTISNVPAKPADISCLDKYLPQLWSRHSDGGSGPVRGAELLQDLRLRRDA